MSINYIPSIEKASDILVQAISSEDYGTVKEILDYVTNDSEIAGSAASFHNAATNLARIDSFNYATKLLEVGIKRYSKDTDLLADIIKYGSKCKSIKDVYVYYKRLQMIRKRFWTWRAYVFSVDYLMEYIQYTETEDDEKVIQKEILSILDEYKRAFPADERAYVAESEYYESMHDREKQIAALREGMEKVIVCCQCALKYADYLFEMGKYEEAIPVAQKAVDIREDQPSISLGYAYYILAMSKEAVLRTNNSRVTDSLVFPVYKAYETAYSYMSKEAGRNILKQQIKNRVTALEIESGIKSNIEFSKYDKVLLNELYNALKRETNQ